MSAYFTHDGASQQGPFTLSDLENKRINKSTLIWREGLNDWVKAGDLPELNSLFASIPPPVNQSSRKGANNSNAINKKRIAFIAAAFFLLAGGIFLYLQNKNKNNDPEKKLTIAFSDTSTQKIKTDTSKKNINLQKDTFKGGIDTSKLNFDTTKNNYTDTAHQTKGNVDMPDYMLLSDKNVHKKTSHPNRNTNSKHTTISEEHQNALSNETEPPAKNINPVNYLTISGNFRKNLILEAVLEGTIYNKSSSVAFRDIIVEVNFIDASGRSIDSKTFIQHQVLQSNQSLSFKLRSRAPLGTKSARYSIAGASIVK